MHKEQSNEIRLEEYKLAQLMDLQTVIEISESEESQSESGSDDNHEK